ncbi:hypothetical protein ACOME3_000022 [Neoechinorhynchus agilis]
MSTVKNILAEAIQFEIEARNDRIVKRPQRRIHTALVKTANISSIARDLILALEDIQHVVPDSERVETRAKGGTPSKYINPPVHFGIDTILSPVALNSPSKI